MMMDREPEVLRLQTEFAAATAECTAALNEQFLALLAGDTDLSRFEERIAKAHEGRLRTMAALQGHISAHGW